MKKSSKEMTLSGKTYQLMNQSNDNSLLVYHLNQLKTLDQKWLTPWEGKQQKKQYHCQSKQKHVQHQFLSKIKFKNKREFMKSNQEQYGNYTPAKGKNTVLERPKFQAQFSKGFQEEIIIFPKSASSRTPNSLKKHKKIQNQDAFFSTRLKWRDRTIKKSNIISLDVQVVKSQSNQRQKQNQKSKLNPQKILSKLNTKNINPNQQNKNKQVWKFKIKHNNEKNNKLKHKEKELSLPIKNYFQYLTQSSTSNKSVFMNRIPKIHSSLRNRLSIHNTNDTLQNKKTVQLNDLFCMGQTISSPNHTRKMKFQKIIGSNRAQTVFLF